MGRLVLFIPILALDLWIILTTWKELFSSPRAIHWRRILLTFGPGILLGLWFSDLAFHLEYHMGDARRLVGFPIPLSILDKQDNTWITAPQPSPFLQMAVAINFLTGIT